MDGKPEAVFQEWLYRQPGRVADAEAFARDGCDLMQYVAAHGVPQRIVSEPGIRVAAYDGRFVGEVRGTGAVLVYAAGVGE